MIPQPVAWYDWILHPIRSRERYKQNCVVFTSMKNVAADVCRRLDAGDFPKHLMSEEEILEWFEKELQKAFYEVIK